MIGRWLPPVLIGLVLAVAAWNAVIAVTPDALMGVAVSRVAEQGGLNRFTHAPLATSDSRALVRPSPDLAYSTCPYDLSAGPLLIDAVPVPAPYWSLSIFDSHTNAVFVRNGAKASYLPFKVAVARTGQVVPEGYQAVRVNGDRGIALVRILIDLPARFPAIDQERRATTCHTG